MNSYLPVKVQLRRVRGGLVRKRGIAFASAELAELEGQLVEIFDLGPAADTLPVYGPMGAFTAVPATEVAPDDYDAYRRRRQAWERGRRRFRADGLASIVDAYFSHEAFLETMWGDRGARTKVRRLRPGA